MDFLDFQPKQAFETSDAAALAAGGGLTAYGVPRALGIRNLYHGTSNDAAKAILQSGLDPNFGGSSGGASAAIDSSAYKGRSQGKVHVTPKYWYSRLFSGLAQAKTEGKALPQQSLLGTLSLFPRGTTVTAPITEAEWAQKGLDGINFDIDEDTVRKSRNLKSVLKGEQGVSSFYRPKKEWSELLPHQVQALEEIGWDANKWNALSVPAERYYPAVYKSLPDSVRGSMSAYHELDPNVWKSTPYGYTTDSLIPSNRIAGGKGYSRMELLRRAISQLPESIRANPTRWGLGTAATLGGLGLMAYPFLGGDETEEKEAQVKTAFTKDFEGILADNRVNPLEWLREKTASPYAHMGYSAYDSPYVYQGHYNQYQRAPSHNPWREPPPPSSTVSNILGVSALAPLAYAGYHNIGYLRDKSALKNLGNVGKTSVMDWAFRLRNRGGMGAVDKTMGALGKIPASTAAPKALKMHQGLGHLKSMHGRLPKTVGGLAMATGLYGLSHIL